jgi:hypothetical protein
MDYLYTCPDLRSTRCASYREPPRTTADESSGVDKGVAALHGGDDGQGFFCMFRVSYLSVTTVGRLARYSAIGSVGLGTAHGLRQVQHRDHRPVVCLLVCLFVSSARCCWADADDRDETRSTWASKGIKRPQIRLTIPTSNAHFHSTLSLHSFHSTQPQTLPSIQDDRQHHDEVPPRPDCPPPLRLRRHCPLRTENRGIQARSNAEAMARGLPLVRPRNVPDSE